MTKATRRYLTKSLFLKACECPRKLLYAASSQKYATKDAGRFLGSLIDDGRKIEAYARLLYGKGIEVGGGGNKSDGAAAASTTPEELAARTRSLLLDPTVDGAIFEGALLSGPLYARSDVLLKSPSSSSPDELRLVEIKAKSWDSRKGREEQLLGRRDAVKAEFLPYVRDAAFQKLVARRSFPHLDVKASLLMPDRAKVNTKVPNLNGIFGADREGSSEEEEADAVDEDAAEAIRESAEWLVTEVDVDDVVDAVLESELRFPGCDGETFEEAVEAWAKIVTSENNVVSSVETASPLVGSRCRQCEYRTEGFAAAGEDGGGLPSGFDECWERDTGQTAEQLAKRATVVDLWHGGRTVDRLVKEGKYRMSDITPEDLGLSKDGKLDKRKKRQRVVTNGAEVGTDEGMSRAMRQWYQASGVPSNSRRAYFVIHEHYLRTEMERWTYPFHFLDFETAAPALPYSLGKSPFDVVAFQFSHHVLREDRTLEHRSEFLRASPGECPNGAFLRSLARSLGGSEGGTVFRWGSHENTVLSALLRQNRESPLRGNGTLEPLLDGGEQSTADLVQVTLEPLMVGGDRSMVDLMQVVTKGYFVEGSGASSSIKKVLLPTMRISERLRRIYGKPSYSSNNFSEMQWWQEGDGTGGMPIDPYSLLALLEHESGGNAIAEGGDAIAAYGTLQREDLDPSVCAKLQSSLLRYCELDTLAMVMMVQALQEFLDG